mgnify:CR=1 FL=1
MERLKPSNQKDWRYKWSNGELKFVANSNHFIENQFLYYADLMQGTTVLSHEDRSMLKSKHALLRQAYQDVEPFSSDQKLSSAPNFWTDAPLFEHHKNSIVFNDAICIHAYVV